MASLTSQLVVRLIDGISGPAKAAAASLRGIGAAARGVNGTGIAGMQARLGNAIAANNAAMDRLHGRMLDAVAGFLALKQAIAGPVTAAMEFESAMADVKKVVDFPTPAAFVAFQRSVRDMAKRIPMAAKSLTEIVAAAGQAGIATEDLTRFTEMAAKVGVAFDISAKDVGEALAKMMTGMALTIPQVSLLTDAMNHLSNAQASSAADILEVIRRTGADGKMFGFTAVQTAAFASAMLSAGAQSDVAATSFRNMGKALTKGAAATKSQRTAYSQLGLNATKVAKAMQRDAVGTTVDVLERINKLPKYMQAAVASELFSDEARALMPLISNVELLKKSLGLVAKESDYAGSATKEYEVRAKTFANSLQLFKNRVNDAGIAIGSILMPPLADMMETLGPIIDRVVKLTEAHPRLTKVLIGTAAGLMGLKIAGIAAAFAGRSIFGGLLLAGKGIFAVVRPLAGAATAAKNAVALQRALGAMGGLKLSGWGTFVASLQGVLRVLPLIGGIAAGISAPVLGLVAGLVAGGALLWRYWDHVASVVSGVAKRLGEEFAPVAQKLAPVLGPLGAAARGLGDAFQWVADKVGGALSWLGQFFSREVLSEDQKAAWAQSGYSAADGLINAVKEKVGELVEWFRALPGKILAAIGSIDVSGLIKWPSMPSWLGGGGKGGGTPATDAMGNATGGEPGRAIGGSVGRGRAYLVGERGRPEIFTPNEDGRVSRPEDFARAGGAGAPAPISITNNITVSGANIPSPADLARMIGRELSEQTRSALRGVHADV